MRAPRLLLAALWACAITAAGRVPSACAQGYVDSAAELAARTDPEKAVEEARQAARDGRTKDAIRAYEKVAALDSQRGRSIQREVAYQYAWAGALGKARAAFRIAREIEPWDYELRLGELMVQNWMGEHQAAARGYEALARIHPEDARPLTGLAAARDWGGRHDLALTALDQARALAPQDPEVMRLTETVRRGLRPTAGLFYDWSEDSDDYQVNAVWAEGSFSPHPQLRLTPYLNEQGIRRPASPPIDETWIGLSAAARPATSVGLSGRLGLLLDRAQDADYAPVTFELGTEAMTSDASRMGFSLSRFALLSYRTLPEKVTGHTWTAWAAWQPDWLTRLRLSADVGFYDAINRPPVALANNRHLNLWLVGSRQVWAPPRLRLGVTARYLDFRRTLDSGIWNPDSYWAAAGTVEWDWGTRDVWSVNGALELGPAQERGGDVTLYGVWRLGAWRVLGPVVLEAAAGHSEGNVGTWTGYDRTYAHAGLRYHF